MKKIILLKLGGSLITDKSRKNTHKLSIIKDISKQIGKALVDDPDIQLIIGNGAGSFGHYFAKIYEMKLGITDDHKKEGYCAVQDGVARLNRIVLKELLQAGVRAVSMQPSAMMTAQDGKLLNFFTDPIMKALSFDLVPVVYGDIVFDEKKGSSIFSTERIFKEIANKLTEQKKNIFSIIHCSVTDGVHDSNGTLIPVIRSDEFDSFRRNFQEAEGYDVTGGMLHKVEESVQLAKQGIPSIIINGKVKNNVYDALIGNNIKGTRIL